MKKFNGMERMLIKDALQNHALYMEREIQTAVDKGKNPIFAKGFFTMQIKHLLVKVDELTRKKDLT
jgi:hypothetical protein|tara:strand:+ start:1110 stop:1307 length:198 start_codon:yes stop_codon:yes gene_type:complete